MDISIRELFPILLFFISFLGLITAKNVIKSIVFVMTMQTSVIMFWLVQGARFGSSPPIIDNIENMDTGAIADPLPQALMLTAIIIGISVMAVIITMLNTLYRKHKTADWRDLKECESKSAEID